MMRILLFILVATSFGLAGCGDREQLAEGKRSYQGKPDSLPWNSEPVAFNGTLWTKGDRASWEAQINRRTETQNEYKRIYQ